MKTITEEQAQELADDLGVYVTTDSLGRVFIQIAEPCNGYSDGICHGWGPKMDGGCCEVTVRISSLRHWTEQIWRPTK